MSTEDFGLNAPVQSTPRRPSIAWRDRAPRRRTSAFARSWFSCFAGLADGVTIAASGLAAGIAYQYVFYNVFGVTSEYIGFSVFVALLFVIFNILRQEYDISLYLSFAGHARRAFTIWNVSFLSALVFVFMTKQTAEYSRGTILLFYGAGVVSIVCCRAFVASKVKAGAVFGSVSAVRAVLIGHEEEIRDFTTRYTPWMFGVDIAASFVLRGPDTLRDDLALAGASARILKPDDIYILLPWSQTEAIDACVAAFMKVPASIHLGPQHVLDRFSSASVSRHGKIYSLHLVRRPMANVDIFVKRALDLAIGIPMFLLLSPFLLAVALAIKFDSPGPVFFLQRRYGFNQETFRIVKFRSMSVAEDGRRVRQAIRNDPRVTRVGRFLRRYNIDELPQLLNVLRGEMSLIGPRPHALIHDQLYERSIADYARRHNVKPGITGWAQIHGLRGEIQFEGMMRQRVEHDLYYIDNWSIGFDLRILAMTLLSPKAFANAY